MKNIITLTTIGGVMYKKIRFCMLSCLLLNLFLVKLILAQEWPNFQDSLNFTDPFNPDIHPLTYYEWINNGESDPYPVYYNENEVENSTNMDND